MKVEFNKLNPEELSDIAVKFLSDAVVRSPSNFHSVDDYINSAKAKKNMIFGAYEGQNLIGSFILNISSGNGRHILILSLLGGKKIKSWRDELVEFLFAMADNNKCTDFSMVGRQGWGRLFPEMKLDGCIYSRRLI